MKFFVDTADVAEIHALIRQDLLKRLADGARVRILYGGSVKPSNAGDVGFEGAFITQINGRYHLICAYFNDGDGKTYDCMAASADKIYGPYGDRYLAIPGGGHNVLFKDVKGEWWSTYFGNDDKAPIRERPAILRVEIGSDNRIKPVAD